MEKQSNIGKVIKKYEAGHAFCINKWSSELLPLVDLVLGQYESLELGPVDQKVFNEMIINGSGGVKKKYQNLVAADLKSFKTGVMRSLAMEKVDGFIEPFERTLDNLLNAFKDAKDTGPYGSKGLSWNDIKIENGKAVLNEQAIQEKYELKIETDDQSELYELAGKFLSAYESLRSFLGSKNKDWNSRVLLNNVGTGLFKLEEDFSISLVPEAIKTV